MSNEKILIVEDEDTTRTLVAAELQKAGYQVFQANNGDEGYQVTKAVRPDLIITDIIMPSVDGGQLIKRVRENGFGRNSLFIVMTSHGQMQGYFEMMDVDDFIVKPVHPEELLTRVERVLAKIRNTKEEG